MKTTRITCGYHHGLNEGGLVKIGWRFYRVGIVGVEAFTVAALPWYHALWLYIKEGFAYCKNRLASYAS